MIARYRGLCLDAVDAPAAARFWSFALGLEGEESGNGGVLRGDAPEQTLWINRVDESRRAKNRLHVDVSTPSVQRLIDAGATVADADTFAWTILRDPDGGELCAFVRDDPAADPFYELVLDCADPQAQATWWHGVIGGELGHDEEHGWSWPTRRATSSVPSPHRTPTSADPLLRGGARSSSQVEHSRVSALVGGAQGLPRWLHHQPRGEP